MTIPFLKKLVFHLFQMLAGLLVHLDLGKGLTHHLSFSFTDHLFILRKELLGWHRHPTQGRCWALTWYHVLILCT